MVNQKKKKQFANLRQHKRPPSLTASMTCNILTVYATCSQQCNNLSLWCLCAALEIHLAPVSGSDCLAFPLAWELRDIQSCLGLSELTELGQLTAPCCALEPWHIMGLIQTDSAAITQTASGWSRDQHKDIFGRGGEIKWKGRQTTGRRRKKQNKLWFKILKTKIVNKFYICNTWYQDPSCLSTA